MSQESHVEWTWQEAREHFSQVDPVFHRLCAVLDDPSESRPRTAFESLSHAIVGQQLSTKAAATIWGRFSALHGDVLSPTSVLEVSPERHRAVGISGQKHGYMQDLARHYLEAPASFDDVAGASNEDIIASWTRVKGLGRWTVQMHLIFQLRRPDVFAPDDLGIRRSMEAHLNMPKDAPRGVYEKRALIWGPFRSAACRFLWDALDNQPK